ncbi:cytochrome P450 [Nonomuraea diastatica]|uniref:Cytochrome P450 n=1 Tax=Nonomuraea diastatica TaxID=1848329 RepID=A0A4R4WJM4_9ACTN|nr:cytochrome P450 [Nonomuraea diastatica]TDD16613.1 cytochrome P450 [Nonomuraea diastatica]
MAAPKGMPGSVQRLLADDTYDYECDRLGFIARRQRIVGDVFRFSTSTVVVSHPELIHHVFLRTNTDFRTEGGLFSGIRTTRDGQERITESIMAARRKGWRGVSRSVCATRGADFLDVLDTLIRGFSGRPVEVLPTMKKFFTFALADQCLGGRGENVTSIAEAYDASANANLRLMNSSLSLPSWLPLPIVLQVKKTRRQAMSLLERHVAARLALPVDRPALDLLDVLVACHGPFLDTAVVVRLLDVVLRASQPGAAVAWAVRQLALRPDHLEKVRAEGIVVREVRRGRSFEASDLPYTTAYLNELLRVYPPTWLMGRWVHRDTTLSGFDLHRGEQVMFSAYHLHRDPRWWDNPDEFRPERWLGQDRPYAGRAYIPFGAGPRHCFGNQLSITHLTLAIAWLADAYDIEVLNSAAAREVPGALLTPRGLKARFRPRR